METKERNLGEEKSTTNEEVLQKKELLSDEQLLGVAGGGDWYIGCHCSSCQTISNEDEKQKCLSNCNVSKNRSFRTVY